MKTPAHRKGWIVCLVLLAAAAWSATAASAAEKPDLDKVVAGGLDWLAAQQSSRGYWMDSQQRYPTAMTALSGVALLCEGSTTTQGKYAANIRKAVDYLVSRSQPKTGLIGDPDHDNRYTYGHGFSMLFLSQVLGEEGDSARRKELIDVLSRAAIFSGQAQTAAGGWGYVSAKDIGHSGGIADEGSTTITQVQGLRGCRNAGIVVPNEIIDNAIKYIHNCTLPDGGVQYSSNGGGGRPAITAAAIACLYNAGQYDDEFVPKQLKYCKGKLDNLSGSGFGHWHYAHYYYAQVMYREGGQTWDEYDQQITTKLLSEAQSMGTGQWYWSQGYIGSIYTTAINLTILQLPNGALPIYQR
ncbi:MAG TPA: prenyltransferase/squalene oxidase repeat-containing protein [Thermoguttaceae bacterium]|nr:prenyltransferase/squalene oxidase repeat-containing protein [Thermoguttaceae bacterium]